jgi:vitamin B12 transporter
VDIEDRTRNWASYVNDTLTLGDASFTAGIRYDNNRNFGDKFSPSGGFVYHLWKNKALVRGQIAEGYSAPQAQLVHYPSVGNPDLGPETSVNYQAGMEMQPFPFLYFDVNWFRADIDNLISYDATTRKYENIDKVSREGVEAILRATFDFGLTLSGSATYVDVRNEVNKEVIPDKPRRIYNVSASYDHEWMTHSIAGKYIYHNSSYQETKDKIFVWDYLVKIKLPFLERYGKASLFGAVYNITNASYIYREVFPQPDRWIEGGVEFVF